MDILSTVPLSWYLILGAALFCIGVYGVLANRNLIVIMMSIELMLNAVVLNLGGVRALHGADADSGQSVCDCDLCHGCRGGGSGVGVDYLHLADGEYRRGGGDRFT